MVLLAGVYLATPLTMADIEPPAKEAAVAPQSKPETFCSCVKYLRTLLPLTPLVDAQWFKDFPKTPPSVGGVAVFYYPTSNQYHVGYITELRDDGFVLKEANFTHCQKDTRFVSWEDSRLIGFWHP